MTRSRLADIVVLAAFGAAVCFSIGLIASDSASGSAAPMRVEIRIRYSHFEPSTLAVPVGRPVTLVLINDDPIEHEWMIGDVQMHLIHRTGTEAHHGSRPTEVSIAPLSTSETTITFDEPLVWQYICHLPGHEAYGMVGTLEAD